MKNSWLGVSFGLCGHQILPESMYSAEQFCRDVPHMEGLQFVQFRQVVETLCRKQHSQSLVNKNDGKVNPQHCISLDLGHSGQGFNFGTVAVLHSDFVDVLSGKNLQELVAKIQFLFVGVKRKP